MANEFVARLGLIALDNSVISGSLTVTGGITGSFQGTASFATTASNVLGGVANYIPLWNGATTLSSSVLYQSSGNIGIGTTSGITGKLTINSSLGDQIKLDRTGQTSRGIVISAADNLSIGTWVDPTQISITPSGSVGIGTTSPTTKLHVVGNIIGEIAGGYQVQIYPAWDTGLGGIGTSTNTGLVLATNSVERMRITTGGNVGIGTTSPSIYSGWTGVDIRGTNGGHLIVGNTAATNRGEIFTDGNGFNISAQTNNALILKTNDTERMRLTSAGNVGIGTTSPSAGYLLDVRGRGKFVSSTGYVLDLIGSGNGQTLIYTDTNETNLISDGSIKLTSSGSVRLFVSSSGNVGIGVTNPNRTLTIGAGGVLGLYDSSNSGQGTFQMSTSGLELYVGASKYIVLGTNSIERVRVDSVGNVGIGTTSPTAKLHISGSSNILNLQGTDAAILIKNTGREYLLQAVDADNRLRVYDNTGNVERITLTTAGNVGIGTASPAYRLDVSGSIGLAGSLFAQTSANYNILYSKTGGAAIYIGGSGDPATYNDNTTHHFRNIGGGTYYATINSTGIGIGTTAPNAAVTVVGSSGDTTSNRDIAVFAENSGIFVDDAGTTNSRLGLVKKAGFSPAIAAGSTTILSLGHWSTVNLLGNIRTGSFTADLSIATNGNVGIGTTSPSTKLHVVGQTYITDDLLIRGTHNPYASGGRGVIALNGTGGNIISFASATTTHGYMFVTNTQYEFVTVANQNFIFYNGSTEALRITNAGNVGIGTTSPGAKFHIVRASSEIPVILDSSNAASSSYTQYRVNGSTGWEAGMAGSGDSYKWFFTYGAFSAANAKIAITSDGSMGIGTVSPSQKLHVEGDILIESGADSVSKLIISNGGSGNAEIIGSEVDGILRIKNGNTGVPVINFLNSSDTVMMSINNSNVGIGTTSPSTKLDVFGNQWIGNDTAPALLKFRGVFGSTYAWNIQNLSTGFQIKSESPSAGDGFNIDFSNNVGIGTTSPAAKLQVQGNTTISGSLNVTGSVTAPSFVGTASFAVSASWAPGGGGSGTVEEPIPAGAKLYLFYNY